MNILMMIIMFSPFEGGAEKQCMKQARALTVRGHQVTILTGWWTWRSPPVEWVDGVRILRMGCLFPLLILARRLHDWLVAVWQTKICKRDSILLSQPKISESETAQVKQKKFRFMAPIEWFCHASFLFEVAWALTMKKFAADIVHVHESHWLAGFAHWVAEKLHAPVFCKEATIPVLGGGYPLDVPFGESWYRRRMECRFIAIITDIASALESAGIPKECIIEIPNGVEVPEVPAAPSVHSDVLYVGNFSQGAAHKGFDILFKAWRLVIEQDPNIKLRMCGSGESEPWKTFVRELSCKDSVIFEGRVEDIVAIHRQCGLSVLPSRKEGLSNALLEAQASGLPAVVSDIPGNRAVVCDGINGLIVPVGDVEALAAAMLKLIRSPELRAQMGKAARAMAMKEFAIEEVATRLENLYRTAIAGDSAQEQRM